MCEKPIQINAASPAICWSHRKTGPGCEPHRPVLDL